MCRECDNQAFYPLPPRRSYRQPMKHMSERKRSAASRINMNQFWNQLEEFSMRREENTVDLDTLQCDEEVEMVFRLEQEDRQELSDHEEYFSAASTDSSCYCSVNSEHNSPLFFPPSPQQPKSFLSSIDQQQTRSLPLPPSFKQSRPLLELMENLRSFTLCTAV